MALPEDVGWIHNTHVELLKTVSSSKGSFAFDLLGHLYSGTPTHTHTQLKIKYIFKKVKNIKQLRLSLYTLTLKEPRFLSDF